MPTTTTSELLSDADARRFTVRMGRARRSTSSELRLAAYLALTRLHDPRQALLLRDGLRDSSPASRAQAAFGLGALRGDAPDEAERWLLLALAAEPNSSVRATITESLGPIASRVSDPAMRLQLEADSPEERVSACRALADVGRRGLAPSAASVEKLLLTLEGEPGPDLALSCTDALGRLPRTAAPDMSERVSAALSAAARSSSAEVRRAAFRALGRRRSGSIALLRRGAEDHDWQVSVAALGALRRRGEPSAGALCGELLREVGDKDWESAAGQGVHRARALASACAPWARDEAVYRPALDAYRAVGGVQGRAAGELRGRVHCALAALVDRGRGWPNESPGCGLGWVSEDRRSRQAAGVIAVVPGADTERGAYLERMNGDATTAVREAVVRAAGHVNAPGATRLLLAGLGDSDRGVVDVSLETLLERAQAWARGEQEGVPRIETTALLPAMRRALVTLEQAEDLEGLGLYIDALGNLPLSELDPSLEPLARHWNVAVRQKARALLRGLGQALPDGAPAAIPDPQRVQVSPGRDLPRVRVRTNRGDFLLELRSDVAPVTAARFLELVDAGFYSGLTFHRIVPGFVVQGGDPRGDGYGGPDFTQRCEDNGLHYERGSVGMALAGRDTGGSQFFVTYGEEPSLDGRYTIFAQVVEGMEVVDALQVDDRMLGLRRE